MDIVRDSTVDVDEHLAHLCASALVSICDSFAGSEAQNPVALHAAAAFARPQTRSKQSQLEETLQLTQAHARSDSTEMILQQAQNLLGATGLDLPSLKATTPDSKTNHRSLTPTSSAAVGSGSLAEPSRAFDVAANGPLARVSRSLPAGLVRLGASANGNSSALSGPASAASDAAAKAGARRTSTSNNNGNGRPTSTSPAFQPAKPAAAVERVPDLQPQPRSKQQERAGLALHLSADDHGNSDSETDDARALGNASIRY